MDLMTLIRPNDETLTVEKLVERLQTIGLEVTIQTIYNLTRKRAKVRAQYRRPLPSYRFGKQLLFSWRELLDWINETTATTPAETEEHNEQRVHLV